jgi:hypothetical protein
MHAHLPGAANALDPRTPLSALGGVGPTTAHRLAAAGLRTVQDLVQFFPKRYRADPTAAAHVLGKLLTHVGEDRVVWGTDSIWFGTPQDQIQAMRSFEISEELQERHGYPALTDEVRAKIFGVNAARLYDIEPVTGTSGLTPEEVEAVRAGMPAPQVYGPTTRSEAAAMIAAHQAGYLT